MGKRKDKEKEHDLSSEKKKQKKHKKHKKRRDRSSQSDNEEIDVVNDDSMREEAAKSLKLKIKFAGKTLSTTEVVSDSGKDEADIESLASNSQKLSSDADAFDDESESEVINRKQTEEDKWLEALEKGELDNSGGLKKVKDKSLMTARQRALHGEKGDEENELIQLPMYPSKMEEDNEEFERKRQLRAKKRRQQMQKQIEETKTQTIEKLLTKGQKTKKTVSRSQAKISGPHIRYQNNPDSITLSFSTELDFPMPAKKQTSFPELIKCSVDGCEKGKKYSCSKTKLPICSFECYKLVNKNQKITVST